MTRNQALEILDTIPTIGEQVDALEMAIESLQKEPRWIPVSERLPKIHNYMKKYIVTIKGNFIRTAFFTESNGKSWWSIDNVIAWMPAPEPYETESEE